MNIRLLLTGIVLALAGCCGMPRQAAAEAADEALVVVLGIAQDAGYPQAACRKACCARAWEDASLRRQVACLGIVAGGRRWMIDATPDFPDQLRMLDEVAAVRDAGNRSQPGLDGIFLTHAHIGHYTGLMHLGREVTGARSVPVYAMPRMTEFLRGNGPWGQLVELENIELRGLRADEPVELAPGLRITPLLVPHRDEYSETVGFRIEGPHAAVLFIPDIDKWERWERALEAELARVDVAYLDGTFYREGEIPGRAMSEIPHPFIEETLALLAGLPARERAKVRFIHLNHTNPALVEGGEAERAIERAGCRVASQGERLGL